jgi:hypothetical protein
MRAYYDQRAAEYDDWWLGTGPFAERDRPGWDEEVGRLVDVIAGLEPAPVLDVACVTGFLTRHLRGEAHATACSSAHGPAAELGGGNVLHQGDWFVVVRARRR